MKKAEISVIIPIYNVEAYLAECLDSVVNQTMDEIEIILVDDCGTDDSMAIAEAYAARDERIKIVRHEKNQGLSAARNTGMANSSAPYIMFIDSDDYAAPDYCEKLYRAIISSNTDIAMCGVHVFGNDHDRIYALKRYFRFRFPHKTALDEDVIERTNCCVWNKICRRDIITKHDILFPVGLKNEDEYWWRLYAIYARNMVYIEDKLYYYRQRAGSIMSNIRKAETPDDDRLRIGMAFYEGIKRRRLTEKKAFAVRFFLWILAVNLRSSQQGSREALHDTAIAFIEREHVTEADCYFKDKHALQLVCERQLEAKYKRFGGLVTIKEKYNRRRVECLGIPVWVIKYKEKKIVHNLFGAIPVFWTYKSKSSQ